MDMGDSLYDADFEDVITDEGNSDPVVSDDELEEFTGEGIGEDETQEPGAVPNKDANKPATAPQKVKASWKDREVELDLSKPEVAQSVIQRALIGEELYQEKKQWESQYQELSQAYQEADESLQGLFQQLDNDPIAYMEDIIYNDQKFYEDPVKLNKYKDWLIKEWQVVNMDAKKREEQFKLLHAEKVLKDVELSERARKEAEARTQEAQKAEAQSKVQSWVNTQWESVTTRVDPANHKTVQRMFQLLLNDAATRPGPVDTNALTKELNDMIKPYISNKATVSANKPGLSALQGAVAGAGNKATTTNQANTLRAQMEAASRRGDIHEVMRLSLLAQK